MTKHLTPLAACLLLASPAALVAQNEADGDVDLDAIDCLFAEYDADTADGDAASDEDEAGEDEAADDAAGEEEAGADETGEDGEASEEEEPPTPSDLTLAFNGYSNCATDAGVELEETGFSVDVIGDEALLRCSGQRAAYVNAFYFSMLPRYPDASEATIRASAERLVAQSDAALAHLIVEEARAARDVREAEAAEEDAPGDDTPDSDALDNDDGEAVADEMEPNA